MRGSIYFTKKKLPPSKKHPNGRNRYYLFSEVGGGRQAHGGFDRLKDVQAAQRVLQGKLADGTFGKPEPENLLVTEYHDRWWADMGPLLLEGACKAYASAFDLYILPYFKKKRMAEITPQHIQDFIGSLNRLSPGYVRTIYSYLRSFFNSAVPAGVIHVTPCRGIKLRKIPKPRKAYFGPTEVWKLIGALKDPYDTFYSIMAFSGIRIGECLGLTLESFDFKAGLIRIDQTWNSNSRSMHLPKTESSIRSVEMITCLAEIVAKYIEDHNLVDPKALLFPSVVNPDVPRPFGTVNGMYRKTLKRLGMRHLPPHSLRHSFSSVMIASGVSLPTLSRNLGHSSPETTMKVYAHEIAEMVGPSLQKVDEVFRAARLLGEVEDDGEDAPDESDLVLFIDVPAS